MSRRVTELGIDLSRQTIGESEFRGAVYHEEITQ
jgi:hypothetical protein